MYIRLIKNIIVKTKKQVAKLNQQVHQKIFENMISDTLEEEFEKKVNNLLNKAISDAGKVGLKSLKNNNDFNFWKDLIDEKIFSILINFKGIGPWSIKMFLISIRNEMYDCIY